ncbi:MAG: RnfABCDGE type electron transport complex subunit G [Bacteroidales bacterium]|nr:RnfABCDGE type electron transport complex subunit G [Bacteroidales bacterium]
MAAKSNLTNMVLVLGLVCLACSAVLGGAYVITKAPIEAAAAAKTQAAVAQVLPHFETLEYNADAHYYTAKDGEAVVGYAIESTVVGFGGPLSLMVGVTVDGVVYNTSVLSHSETPGLGAKCSTDAKFMDQWRGFDPAVKKLSVKKDGGDVDAITASTITSRAYTLAVENALKVFDGLEPDEVIEEDEPLTEEGGQDNE